MLIFRNMEYYMVQNLNAINIFITGSLETPSIYWALVRAPKPESKKFYRQKLWYKGQKCLHDIAAILIFLKGKNAIS